MNNAEKGRGWMRVRVGKVKWKQHMNYMVAHHQYMDLNMWKSVCVVLHECGEMSWRYFLKWTIYHANMMYHVYITESIDVRQEMTSIWLISPHDCVWSMIWKQVRNNQFQWQIIWKSHLKTMVGYNGYLNCGLPIPHVFVNVCPHFYISISIKQTT